MVVVRPKRGKGSRGRGAGAPKGREAERTKTRALPRGRPLSGAPRPEESFLSPAFSRSIPERGCGGTRKGLICAETHTASLRGKLAEKRGRQRTRRRPAPSPCTPRGVLARFWAPPPRPRARR
eukprot:scaffold112_cov282-Prasinococcus_capsulatus_cf.AAC.1